MGELLQVGLFNVIITQSFCDNFYRGGLTMYHFLDPNPQGSPLVVFIHGLGADSEMWVYQMQVLVEAGMRPIAMDLPGFGKTPWVGKEWNIHEVAKGLADWLRQFSPGKKVIVGLSMGGVIAQQIALDFPEQVERLVLVSTFATLRPSSWKNWIYLLRRGGTVLLNGSAAQAEQVADHLFPDASQAFYHQMVIEKIHQADPRAYQKAMRSLMIYDSRRDLVRLSIPVLVITGKNDGTVPPIAQEELTKCILGAHQVIIPMAGHAVNIDQSQLFNQVLLAFIQSIGS
jgi:3-oxoadipate enol-lactonase